jgi:hypothetical protein
MNEDIEKEIKNMFGSVLCICRYFKKCYGNTHTRDQSSRFKYQSKFYAKVFSILLILYKRLYFSYPRKREKKTGKKREAGEKMI